MKENFKKYTKNILKIFPFFLIMLSVVLSTPIRNLDELWNYNFANNIYNGLIPYKDFNMLQMPLLPFIVSVIFKLTTNELIVSKIVTAILFSVFIYLIYKIFELFEEKEIIKVIKTLFVSILSIYQFSLDYNWLSLIFVLLLIYIEIKEFQKEDNKITYNPKKDIFIGFLACLPLTLKQTSGMLVCFIALFNKFLLAKNKKDFTIALKSFIYRAIGMIIPAITLLLYLICNNTFSDFINYTLLGIKEFNNHISYFNLFKFNLIGVFSIIMPLFIPFFIYKTIKTKDTKKYFILVYGLTTLIILYPIADMNHFIIAMCIFIVAFINDFSQLLSKIKIKTKIKNMFQFFILVIFILYLLLMTTVNFYNYFTTPHVFHEHYKHLTITNNLNESLTEVSNYIKNSKKDVKILDASAAFYMIPINKYNKHYDLLLKGNLGLNGTEKLISEIKESQNTQYLIMKNEKGLNYQTPLEIINFVKENKTKVGEINKFDIYE